MSIEFYSNNIWKYILIILRRLWIKSFNFFRILPISFLIRFSFPLMIYHKQATVASFMYKYLSASQSIGCARIGAPLTQPGRAHFRLLSPACHVRRGTLDSLQFSAGPLHHAGPCGVWDRIGESRSRRLSCRFFRFTFILVRLGYFTFDTTNLSLRYGSVLSKLDCKFKVVWSCFPIIFPRPSSLRKETWTPCDRGGARMRFVGYFSSLNH